MKDLNKAVGFTLKDMVSMFWFSATKEKAMFVDEIHAAFLEAFPGRDVSYDYVARIAKSLEKQQLLTVQRDQNKKYYRVTESGIEQLNRYSGLYKERTLEVYQVVQRIEYHLTRSGNGPIPITHELPQEYRTFLAKLFSIKDLTRYLFLYYGQTRSQFYAAEVEQLSKEMFGWSPSNPYVHKIASELEADGAIIGEWAEPVKRTVRFLRLTEDGKVFFKQIESDLTVQIQNIRKFLGLLILFFE